MSRSIEELETRLEDLRKNIEKAEKIFNDATKKIGADLTATTVAQIEDYKENLRKETQAQISALNERLETQRAHQTKIREINQKITATDDEVLKQKFRNERALAIALRKAQQDKKKALEKEIKDIDRLARARTTSGKKFRKQLAAADKRLNAKSEATKRAEVSLAKFNKALKDGANAGARFVGGLTDVGLELAAFQQFKPELGLAGILKTMVQDAVNFDDEVRKISRSTGVSFDFLADTVEGAANATAGSREVFRQIGLSPAEAAEAVQELTNSTDILRKSLARGDKALAETLANQVAAFKKFGVASAASAKSLDIFNRVLGNSGKQSGALNKQLLVIAKELKINVNKAFQDFGSQVNFLSSFGSKTTEVFAGLSAVVRATGIELGTLGSLIEKLDTQEGASRFAARLNAIFGETAFNATELANLMGSDKVAFIVRRFKELGVAERLQGMGEREAMITRRLIGEQIGSVEAANRLLRGDALEDIMAALEDAQRGVEKDVSKAQIEKEIRATMTAEQRAQAARDELAKSARKTSAMMRRSVVNANNAIRDSMRQVKREVGDTETAFLGIASAVFGLEGVANALTKFAVADKRVRATAAAIGAGLIATEAGPELTRELNKLKNKEKRNKLKEMIESRNRAEPGTKLFAKRDKAVKDEVRRLQKAFGVGPGATDVRSAPVSVEQQRDRNAAVVADRLQQLRERLQRAALATDTQGETAKITPREIEMIGQIISKVAELNQDALTGATFDVRLAVDGQELAAAISDPIALELMNQVQSSGTP